MDTNLLMRSALPAIDYFYKGSKYNMKKSGKGGPVGPKTSVTSSLVKMCKITFLCLNFRGILLVIISLCAVTKNTLVIKYAILFKLSCLIEMCVSFLFFQILVT